MEGKELVSNTLSPQRLLSRYSFPSPLPGSAQDMSLPMSVPYFLLNRVLSSCQPNPEIPLHPHPGHPKK